MRLRLRFSLQLIEQLAVDGRIYIRLVCVGVICLHLNARRLLGVAFLRLAQVLNLTSSSKRLSLIADVNVVGVDLMFASSRVKNPTLL